MNKMISGLMATAIAASFAIMPVAEAGAASAYMPKAPQADTAMQQVQYDGYWKKRRVMRSDSASHFRAPRSGFYRERGDVVYFNGHRGYRDYRPGYRRHNNFWFPAGAFIAGAIIGGAIANQPQPRYVQPSRYGNAHVQWCYDRYRSYRASDNTFQPYNGPRQQCYSPY
ncbi:BA14K family protein [Aminobacter sp. BA135]|uniref:BA14K family protein n=1 Tax=Aminobacter sp. BA135 TaxID=537596 RepID=UPI003D79F39D